MMSVDQLVQTVSLAAIPVLFAITLHEVAHGFVARHYGDMTAYQQGRLSLNPARHIDPFGTVLLPLMTLWLGGLMFGWAKPVPVNFGALRHPKKDMLWVSIAGPAANIAMAMMWALLAKIALGMPDNYFAQPLLEMSMIGIKINVVLAALNMLPLPPLDGGRVLISLLPHREAYQLSRIEPYGMFILIFLAFTPILWWVLSPFMNALYFVIQQLFGL